MNPIPDLPDVGRFITRYVVFVDVRKGSGGFDFMLTIPYPRLVFLFSVLALFGLSNFTQAIELTQPSRVHVILHPDEAVTKGASWSIDGQGHYHSGEVGDATASLHTLSFSPLPEWKKVPDKIIRSIGAQEEIVEATYEPLPIYPLEEIPNQTIWHGQRLEFLIQASQSALSYITEPTPEGAIQFQLSTSSPDLWYFSYTSSANDKEPFRLSFSKPGATVPLPAVEINPLPHIPPEYEVFGIEPSRPLPNPEYFIRVTSSMSAEAIEFNTAKRQVRIIDIAGITVVFRKGHPNGLYDTYHENADIQTMNIYAETVIIQSPFRLPQTNVSIYAKKLIFEDAGMLITSPMNYPTNADNSTSLDHIVNALDGLKAGDITLNLESIQYNSADPYMTFCLLGGNGQNAGSGRNGTDGSSVPAIGGWEPKGDPFKSPDCPWPNNAIYAAATTLQWRGSGVKGYSEERGAGKEIWPSDGENAIPGGKPGSPGDYGNFSFNIDSLSILGINERLNEGTAIEFGKPGNKAGHYSGGKAGQPNPAYRVMLHGFRCKESWFILETHTQKEGASVDSPGPDRTVGKLGINKKIGHALSWISPYACKQILLYAKHAYLEGYSDYVRNRLPEIIVLLDAYQNRPEWKDVPKEWRMDLKQIGQEMVALVNQIDSHLDYFGNPPGWVPMLSFEVNKMAFDKEIDSAIRVLYLTYWLTTLSGTLQQRVEALNYSKAQLRNEIQTAQEAYNATLAQIPELENQADSLDKSIEVYQSSLFQLEEQLMARAQQTVEDRNEVPSWKRALGFLGTFFRFIPTPVTQGIGFFMGVVSSAISQEPSPSIDSTGAGMAHTIHRIRSGDFKKAASEVGNLLKQFDSANSPQSATQAVAMLNAGKELERQISEIVTSLNVSEMPRTEIDAELLKIKASNPEFQGICTQLAQLMVEKDLFVQKLTQTIQSVSKLSTVITNDLLAVDWVSRSIERNAVSLDPRSYMFLLGMENRAKDRLQKYHYFITKSYEYRMVERYPGDLNLGPLFDTFKEIIGKGNTEAPDKPYTLSSADFESLKALYAEQLSCISSEIFAQLNTNYSEQESEVYFNLSENQLAQLNAGETISINLVQEGLFPESEENIRILDLALDSIVVDDQTASTKTSSSDGSSSVPASPQHVDSSIEYNYMTIQFVHSGHSLFSNGGDIYYFQHYNRENNAPINWAVTYDLNKNLFSMKKPSADQQSLLKSLLDSKSIELSEKNLVLYSRPSAWTNLLIAAMYKGTSATSPAIRELKLRLSYSFSKKKPSMKALHIVPSEKDLTPYFILDRADTNSRKDGRGDFTRNYYQNSSVAIQATREYGQWRFDHWTAKTENALQEKEIRENPTQLTITSNTKLTAHYKHVSD